MRRRQAKHLITLAFVRSKSSTVALNALRFCIEYGRYDDLTKGARSSWGDLDIEGYAEHVGISRATAFRRQGAYRKCFPEQEVLDLWSKVIKPNLDASAFKDEHPTAQAVFAGTLTIEFA